MDARLLRGTRIESSSRLRHRRRGALDESEHVDTLLDADHARTRIAGACQLIGERVPLSSLHLGREPSSGSDVPFRVAGDNP
jgi:hypothetical protein